jgi:hypothetical protein
MAIESVHPGTLTFNQDLVYRPRWDWLGEQGKTDSRESAFLN